MENELSAQEHDFLIDWDNALYQCITDNISGPEEKIEDLEAIESGSKVTLNNGWTIEWTIKKLKNRKEI